MKDCASDTDYDAEDGDDNESLGNFNTHLQLELAGFIKDMLH